MAELKEQGFRLSHGFEQLPAEALSKCETEKTCSYLLRAVVSYVVK